MFGVGINIGELDGRLDEDSQPLLTSADKDTANQTEDMSISKKSPNQPYGDPSAALEDSSEALENATVAPKDPTTESNDDATT